MSSVLDVEHSHAQAIQHLQQILPQGRDLHRFGGMPAASLERVLEIQDQARALQVEVQRLWRKASETVELETLEEQTNLRLASEACNRANSEASNAQNQYVASRNEQTKARFQQARKRRIECIGQQEAAQLAFQDARRTYLSKTGEAERIVEIELESRQLLVDFITLLEGAGHAQQLEDAVARTLSFVENDYERARDYHRSAAKRLMVTLVVSGILAGILLTYLFFESRNDLRVTSGSKMGAAIYSLAGRLALLALVGWLLLYFGRVVARHAQQAVTYQDRKAGLNAAEQLLAYASTDERKDVLNHVMGTYIALDTNAFKEATPQRDNFAAAKPVIKEFRETLSAVIKAK